MLSNLPQDFGKFNFGFHKIIHRAHLHPPFDIFILTKIAQDKNGRASRFAFTLYFRQDFKPVLTGKYQIKNNEVWLLLSNLVKTLLALNRLYNFKTLCTQFVAVNLLEELIVFYDEYL